VVHPGGGRAAHGWRDLEATPWRLQAGHAPTPRETGDDTPKQRRPLGRRQSLDGADRDYRVRGSEEVRQGRARRWAAATPTTLLVPVLSSSSALDVSFRRSDGREHTSGGGWMLVSSQAPTTSQDEMAWPEPAGRALPGWKRMRVRRTRRGRKGADGQHPERRRRASSLRCCAPTAATTTGILISLSRVSSIIPKVELHLHSWPPNACLPSRGGSGALVIGPLPLVLAVTSAWPLFVGLLLGARFSLPRHIWSRAQLHLRHLAMERAGGLQCWEAEQQVPHEPPQFFH
jgi:hypothetical protein